MDPAELETLVARELKALPLPRAPHTLVRQVMAAVEQRARRPWYTRVWLTWPLGWQIASAAALLLLVALGAMLLPGAQAAAGVTVSRVTSGFVMDLSELARRVEAATNIVRVLWRALIEPLVAYAYAIVVLMCLACAAFVTALNHLAFGRTQPS